MAAKGDISEAKKEAADNDVLADIDPDGGRLLSSDAASHGDISERKGDKKAVDRALDTATAKIDPDGSIRLVPIGQDRKRRMASQRSTIFSPKHANRNLKKERRSRSSSSSRLPSMTDDEENDSSKGSSKGSSKNGSCEGDGCCIADPNLVLNGQVLTCTTDLSESSIGSKGSSKGGSKRMLQQGNFLDGKVGCADLTSSIVKPCDDFSVHVTYVMDLSTSTACPCGDSGGRTVVQCERDGLIGANSRLAASDFFTSVGIVSFGFQIDGSGDQETYVSDTELSPSQNEGPQDPVVTSTFESLSFRSGASPTCSGGALTFVNLGYSRAADSVSEAFAIDPGLEDSFVIWVTDGNLAEETVGLTDAINTFQSFGTKVYTFAIGADSQCAGQLLFLSEQTGGVCTFVSSPADLENAIVGAIVPDEQMLERVTITVNQPDGSVVEVDGCPVASCRADLCPTEVRVCEPIELTGSGTGSCTVTAFTMDGTKTSSCPVEFEI